jgi:hypothetical protein
MTPTKRHWVHNRAEALTSKIKLPFAFVEARRGIDGPGVGVTVTTRRRYVSVLLDLGNWSACWRPATDPTSPNEDDRHSFGSLGWLHMDFRTPAPGGDLRRDEVMYRVVSRF